MAPTPPDTAGPGDWPRLQDLLDDLLDRPPAERAAGLAAIADPHLRARLASLLRADERAGLLDRPAGDLAAALLEHESEPVEEIPSLAPRYRVTGEIGRGGMGVVYEAERADGAFAQRVAVKVLNHGLGSEAMRRRFELERQILARFEHPGIARLLDGGTTQDGRPFLVMEKVAGQPITAYADRMRLGVGERIDLFVEACRAVAYAQRHLVVHRDLKPSNVLVDDTGRVRLLDFGIAKRIGEWEEAPAADARTVVPMMTPEYAAPEQIRGEPPTTATDVWSLGVVLYELMSGRRPHAPDAAHAAEVAHAVLHDEPAPLARATAAGGATSEDVAAARRATPAGLRRALRGELSLIVERCLKQDPAERYPSAQALLDELLRYRAGEPIEARGDSLSYRIRKTLARHRLAAAAAALVVLALGAGLVGTAWQANIASREAARARIVQEFLTGLFAGANPDAAPGRPLSAVDLLDRGAERIEGELAARPDVQAELSSVVGNLYRSLGRYGPARPLLERALAWRERRLGSRDPRTVAALVDLGTLETEAADFARADSLYARALALHAAARMAEDTTYAALLNDIAVLRSRQDRSAEAESLLRRVLALDRRLHGADHPEVATDLNNLGVALERQGNHEAAEQAHREALEIRRRRLPPNHSTIPASLHNLATVRWRLGDTGAADSLFREAIALRRAIHPAGHPDLAHTLISLAQLVQSGKRWGEADSLIHEALAMNRRAAGPDHPRVAECLNELGLLTFRRGNVAGAVPHFRVAVEIAERSLPPGHSSTLTMLGNLATVERRTGQLAAAEASYRKLFRGLRLARGEDHPGTRDALGNLAAVLRERGHSEAETGRRIAQLEREPMGGR